MNLNTFRTGPSYREGWVCPKCGAVMSPDERHCINCVGNMHYLNIVRTPDFSPEITLRKDFTTTTGTIKPEDYGLYYGQTTKTKRKVGRPRKIVNPENAKPKRPRGRPRKNTTIE